MNYHEDDDNEADDRVEREVEIMKLMNVRMMIMKRMMTVRMMNMI